MWTQIRIFTFKFPLNFSVGEYAYSEVKYPMSVTYFQTVQLKNNVGRTNAVLMIDKWMVSESFYKIEKWGKQR